MFIRTSSNDLVNVDKLAMIKLLRSEDVHHAPGYMLIAGFKGLPRFLDAEPDIILERFNSEVHEDVVKLVFTYLMDCMSNGADLIDLGDIAEAVREAGKIEYDATAGILTVTKGAKDNED